ncbi:MAG: hypothetical protein EZS28_028110 [Streblomastix strix]|uniref:Uncharacterized protein n=1 Tax=Streblomastix strix TaxID=222440 RepID=A0A5J4V1W6_9EUKA|nr:MAG: hypothetical protein EZS28_028110 [Streblomastix strix]
MKAFKQKSDYLDEKEIESRGITQSNNQEEVNIEVVDKLDSLQQQQQLKNKDRTALVADLIFHQTRESLFRRIPSSLIPQIEDSDSEGEQFVTTTAFMELFDLDDNEKEKEKENQNLSLSQQIGTVSEFRHLNDTRYQSNTLKNGRKGKMNKIELQQQQQVRNSLRGLERSTASQIYDCIQITEDENKSVVNEVGS